MAATESRPEAAVDSTTFVTAMTHLYRGEMNRLTVWRQRLDVTTNWAVILTTALSTFALGTADVPHYTLLLGLALIAFSITIEGRRYRRLHHTKWRVYLLENGFFAELLDPGSDSSPGWRRRLAADLRQTDFQISRLLAVRVRLRRNYLMLIYFLAAAWLVKLYIHPTNADSLPALFSRLHIGGLFPSWLVGLTAVLFLIAVTALALSCPPAERLEDWAGHDGQVRSRRAQE